MQGPLCYLTSGHPFRYDYGSGFRWCCSWLEEELHSRLLCTSVRRIMVRPSNFCAGTCSFIIELDLGWSTKGTFTSEGGVLHYVYVCITLSSLNEAEPSLQTLPPVAISMVFAGFWTWTDVEIRRLQVSLTPSIPL